MRRSAVTLDSSCRTVPAVKLRGFANKDESLTLPLLIHFLERRQSA